MSSWFSYFFPQLVHSFSFPYSKHINLKFKTHDQQLPLAKWIFKTFPTSLQIGSKRIHSPDSTRDLIWSFHIWFVLNTVYPFLHLPEVREICWRCLSGAWTALWPHRVVKSLRHPLLRGVCTPPHSVHMCNQSRQSCSTLCDPMDCSPPGSSVHGILWARILEWVAMPSSRGSSQPRDPTWVSGTAERFFTVWAWLDDNVSCWKCPFQLWQHQVVRDL